MNVIENKIERLLISPREAAKMLSICERTLYSMTQRGLIPAVHLGRCVRYDVDSLKAFIKKSLENN